MLSGINKILKKYQKLLLLIIGLLIIIPFIGFVPGTDIFDIFSKNSNREINQNTSNLKDKDFQKQIIAFTVGKQLRIAQNYANLLDPNDTVFSSNVAIKRMALIQYLASKYNFNNLKKETLKQFLIKQFKTIKTAKLYLHYIQNQFGLTPKEMENIIVENYFIKKNEQKLKNKNLVDKEELQQEYIKQNTSYKISSLKFSSSTKEFFDAKAQAYYDKNKNKYKQISAIKSLYAIFDKKVIQTIHNIDDLVYEEFNKNKAKYKLASHQQQISIIGIEVKDFNDTTETSIKRKIFDRLKESVRINGFKKTKSSQKSLINYQKTYWLGQSKNIFYNSVKNLKKGAISPLIIIKNHADYKQGFYFAKVTDERTGFLTPLAEKVITEEIITKKNKIENKRLAQIFYNQVKKEINKINDFKSKKDIFIKKITALKIGLHTSPFFNVKGQKSHIYSNNLIQQIIKLSKNSPLSKIIQDNNKYIIAFYQKKNKPYKAFTDVKKIIKQTIYKQKAVKYYNENKEDFKLPQIKYGYAVSFNPRKKITISNQESLAYYKNNNEDFNKKQARINILNINFNKKTKQEITQKLNKIIQDIKTRKITFKEAILKYSNDTELKAEKKVIKPNWITEGYHPASKIIFATKVNELSEIYTNNNSVKIFKVDKFSQNIPYPRVKDDIVKFLKNKKSREYINKSKANFYNQAEKLLVNNGNKNYTKKFIQLCRSNKLQYINISTQDNFPAIKNLILELKLKNEDSPLIINDHDPWIGCYTSTDEAKYPIITNNATLNKAVNIVNQEEAIKVVNAKFTKIFTTLNKANNKTKANLLKKFSFTQENSLKYKDLPINYKQIISSHDKINEILITKDAQNEHIILVITNKQVIKNTKNIEPEFLKKFKNDKDQKIIDEFYKNLS